MPVRRTDLDRRARWWRITDERKCADALWGWIDRLKTRSRAENMLDLIHEAIYEGRPLGTQLENPILAHLRPNKSAPANLNITRSMVDTGTSRLSKNRPMPVISADDAGWTEKLFGKRASRVLRRKLGKSDVERMRPDVVRDSMIRGTGVTKVVRDGGDITYERCPRHELRADPREARYGWKSLRTLAQVKRVPLDVLREEYPDYADEIDAAAEASTDEFDPADYDSPNTGDLVEVGEGWHLPTAPGAKDGVHVIAIRGCVLLLEPWRRPRFPFALMHWSAPVRGIWGHGLVEDLTGVQAKVNDVARDIQEALYYGAALKIFAARGSNVNKSHLRARHPVVVEYDGARPEYVAGQSVPEAMIRFLEWLINKAYEIAGISQLQASSKNPLGAAASGKALDTMYDIGSDRFAHVELAQSTYVCDLAQCTLDEAQALSEEAGEKDSEIKRKDLAAWIREVDWRKVKVDEGDYHLTIEAINFIPDTRAGKLSYVNELAKAGVLTDPTQIASLFDEPDMARLFRTKLGPYNNILRIAEGLADPDVPLYTLQPDPHMNLAFGIEMIKAEYNDAQSTDAPEVILDRYRQWIDFARNTKKLAERDDMAMAPPSNSNLAGAPMAGMAPPLGMPPPMAPPAMGAPPAMAPAPAPGMIAA